jgi:hypothetical protein
MPRRKPKQHKHTYKDLVRLRDTFIEQLKAKSTPDADRTLDIYRSMRATESGEPRTTLSQQIEVLGCRQWQQVLRCLNTGTSTKEHVKVCRRRFLCLNCHKWKLQSQVERWLMSIKQALRRQDVVLGPLVQIRWDIPEDDKCASLGRFDRFVENTLMRWLGSQGIDSGEYLICRTFDPIQSAVRAVYAGPPILRDLWLRIYTLIPPERPISHKSLKIPPMSGRGRPCPWLGKATDFGEAYLLNPDNPTAGESDCFDRTLRERLFWCVGGMEDLLHLKREEVWRTYARFNRTRLFSTRGLIYESASSSRIERLLNPQEHPASMLIEKQYRDGSVEMVVRDTMRLLGSESAELPDMSTEKICPGCGKPIASPGHEFDGEPIKENKEGRCAVH